MKNSLRILSYNVHKGFNVGNRRYLLDDIRESIREVNADVVFLQEIVGENRRHARRLDNWVDASQFEYLADSVWPHFAYGRNAVYEHGHHGNAILSKYPIVHSDNINVSVSRNSHRGLLMAMVAPDIYLICVHMGLMGWERERQFQLLSKAVHQRVPATARLIVAGDFNDWRLRLHRPMCANLGLREALTEIQGRPAQTFPAKRPLLPVDRIYFRGFDVSAAEVLRGEPWRSLSDHCALYTELRNSTR